MIKPPSRPFSLLPWLNELLKPIGDLRDGLLVTATILYITGYLVWSFNAWQNNLGLLPALDAQYFVAGLVPVLILSLAYLIGRSVQYFLLKVWPRLVGPQAIGVWLAIRTLLLFLYWGLLGLLVVGPIFGAIVLLGFCGFLLLKKFKPNNWLFADRKQLTKQQNMARIALVLVFVSGFCAAFLLWRDELVVQLLPRYKEIFDKFWSAALIVNIIFLPPTQDKYLSWMSKLLRYFWLYLGVSALVVLGFIFYAQSLYPLLPQEFGGVRPRCAYLDMVKAEVSAETLAELVPVTTPQSNQTVVRSVPLELLYSGHEVMLVRAKGRVHEITRSVIQATKSCP